MFEHLLEVNDAEYTPEISGGARAFVAEEDADVGALIDGKVQTRDWLEKVAGSLDDDVIATAQEQASRETFHTLTSGMTVDDQKKALSDVTTPAAVQHLVGMLTAYDWAFVERAKELRGYCVAKIVEETTHPDAKIRLRALDMLGKVTEIGLFTERIEVRKAELSDAELDEEIKKRTERYMGLLRKVEAAPALDVEVTEVPEVAVEAIPDEPDTDA